MGVPTSSEPDGHREIEEFDGGADDVVMPDEVRRAAEARIKAAERNYGRSKPEE